MGNSLIQATVGIKPNRAGAWHLPLDEVVEDLTPGCVPPGWLASVRAAALLNGRLANFSSERLMRLLTRLGQDIEIVLKAKPRRRNAGRIRVIDELRA